MIQCVCNSLKLKIMINSISDLQVEGTLIIRDEIQFPSNKFKFREVVLEVNSNVDSDNTIEYLKMRFLQERTALLDEIRCGYRVLVTYKITGRKWVNNDKETVYFTNLEGINLEVLDDTHNFEKDKPIPGSDMSAPPESFPDPSEVEEHDDLPF